MTYSQFRRVETNAEACMAVPFVRSILFLIKNFPRPARLSYFVPELKYFTKVQTGKEK